MTLSKNVYKYLRGFPHFQWLQRLPYDMHTMGQYLQKLTWPLYKITRINLNNQMLNKRTFKFILLYIGVLIILNIAKY